MQFTRTFVAGVIDREESAHNKNQQDDTGSWNHGWYTYLLNTAGWQEMRSGSHSGSNYRGGYAGTWLIAAEIYGILVSFPCGLGMRLVGVVSLTYWSCSVPESLCALQTSLLCESLHQIAHPRPKRKMILKISSLKYRKPQSSVQDT